MLTRNEGSDGQRPILQRATYVWALVDIRLAGGVQKPAIRLQEGSAKLRASTSYDHVAGGGWLLGLAQGVVRATEQPLRLQLGPEPGRHDAGRHGLGRADREGLRRPERVRVSRSQRARGSMAPGGLERLHPRLCGRGGKHGRGSQFKGDKGPMTTRAWPRNARNDTGTGTSTEWRPSARPERRLTWPV